MSSQNDQITALLSEWAAEASGDTAVTIAVQKAGGAYQGNEVPGDLGATLVLVNMSRAWRLAGIHMSFTAGTPDAPSIPRRPAGGTQ